MRTTTLSRPFRLSAIAASSVLLLALTGCGAGTGSGDLDGLTSSAPVAESTTAEASESAEEPAEESSAPAPDPVAKAVVYKGSGNKVLKIKKPDTGLVLMTTVIKGPRDNNTIYSLDSELEESDLLVNTIGSYTGTTLLDNNYGDFETKRLKIDVSGSWVITLRPISAAKELTTAASGSKDQVLKYLSGDPAIMNFASTSGDSNVTVYWLTEDGEDLLVNDIGTFKAEAPMTSGPGLLLISSDGKWSMKVEGA